jgi:hypothetical protein
LPVYGVNRPAAATPMPRRHAQREPPVHPL